jgi:hypothetical protein
VTAFPTYVTHAQKLAACEALGLPAEIVTDVHMSATNGVSVTVQILDHKGRLLAQGDGPLTADIHLPYDYHLPESEGTKTNRWAEACLTVGPNAPTPDQVERQG